MSHIGQVRLASQLVSPPSTGDVVAVVRHMLAMQGQDYAGLLWSIGLRVPGATLATVEAAFANGEIVRAWPMRGTLHATAAEDLPWLVDLLCPRVIQTTTRRRDQLSLDDKTLARARTIAEKSLSGANHKTREEMLSLFEAKGISTEGQRGYHILFHLATTRTLCFGPPRPREKKSTAASEQTFTLLEEWIKKPRKLERDEALGELATRYFLSHGPATVVDFTAWTKLTAADVKRALDVAKKSLRREGDYITHVTQEAHPRKLARTSARSVHLLSGFDEFILGYRDRSAVLDAEHAQRVVPGGNGVFMPTIVQGGRVIGTWRRSVKKAQIAIEPELFESAARLEGARNLNASFNDAADAYRRFVSGAMP